MNPAPKLLPFSQAVTLGCDPEFFFTRDGKIIGSEKVIKDEKKGIPSARRVKKSYDSDETVIVPTGSGLTVIDGVQAELHPSASNCRDVLGENIKDCLVGVEGAMGDAVKANFSQVVDVTKEELDTMDDKNKRFGCSASLNTHKTGRNKVTTIKADPMKYLKRSAGGHIHLGAQEKISKEVLNPKWNSGTDPFKYHKYIRVLVDNPHFLALKNPDVLVPVLDIILGNTCVMLDRSEGNVERRKNYGKAGEYRLPKYGLEYRTLSNFWLISKPVFSLVFGLARQAANIVAYNDQTGHVEQLMSLVDMKDITKAINENDMELAAKNWNKIEGFILAISGNDPYGHYPITSLTIEGFHKLVDNGIGHYFKQSPIDAWTRPKGASYIGFSQWAIEINNQ